jgi:ATP-dependent DNA helicase RecG
MTLAELQKLVADSKGEWEHLEFKKTTGELHGGMETLCAFLNGLGGKVLFGVTNAGRIQGQDTSDATFQEVANAIRKLEPPAWIEQIRVPVAGTKEVLILETTQQTDGPYAFDGRPYQRIGNTTSRMPQAEYQRRLLARVYLKHRWENQPAERYTVADLDLAEVERVHRIAIDVQRLETPFTSRLDTLDRLQLRRDGHLLQAAVVLFGKKQMPDYPQCALRMARFRGTTKDEFIDQRQIHAHAFDILEEASLFLQRHVAVAGWFEEGKLERQEKPGYPFLALREAIVNAICHRDYSIPGGAVHIAIYDDRLEIISTGLLPPGITVADLKRDHPSRPRNPLIAEPFYLRALIEKWGRGTQRIVTLCREGGYPAPEFLEAAGAVTVRFPAAGYLAPTKVRPNLTERQRRILSILSDGRERSFPDLFEALESPPSARTVQVEMRVMRDLGFVDSRGRGKSARWWLKEGAS